MTLKPLEQLLARVREAKEPSRQLDDDIWMAACHQDHWREIARGSAASRFTESIDASIALAERVLPEPSIWRLTRNSLGFEATVYVEGHSWIEDADTAPLALLAAVLAALISQRE